MREGGFRNIGGLAQRLTSGIAKGRGTSIARLRADWPAIAGAELARTTQPEALLAGRGGRTGGKALRLRVAGAAALEVQHMREQLIDRVNAYFGHRAVDDIRLVQGAIAQRPLPRVAAKPDAATAAAVEARVAGVRDPELRAALARLGARVATGGSTGRRGVLLGLLATAFAADEVRAQPNPLAITEKDRVLGRASAPITIVEYASLTCPHCGAFHRDVLPQVKKEWIDTGKAKLVYRNFPLNAQALTAAKVAECMQGERYFGLLDVLFQQMDRWAAQDPVPGLTRLGKLGGLGEEQIKACLTDAAAEKRILQKQLIGQQQLGVSSTPTFFINGKKIVGVEIYDMFRQALAAAGS